MIVYNLLHPEILFNKSKSGLKKDLEENRNFLKKEGISFFDFSDYILKNYDQSNIDKIMKSSFVTKFLLLFKFFIKVTIKII